MGRRGTSRRAATPHGSSSDPLPARSDGPRRSRASSIRGGAHRRRHWRSSRRSATARTDQGRAQGSGGPSGEGFSAPKAMRAAADQLEELLGRAPASVSAVKHTDDGWQADADVVDVDRVPATTSDGELSRHLADDAPPRHRELCRRPRPTTPRSAAGPGCRNPAARERIVPSTGSTISARGMPADEPAGMAPRGGCRSAADPGRPNSSAPTRSGGVGGSARGFSVRTGRRTS